MLPPIKHCQSTNGWHIYHCQQKYLPIFSLRLLFTGGCLDAALPGLTRLTDHLFLRYLHTISREKIISGDLHISSHAQYSILSIDGLQEEFTDVLSWITHSIQNFSFSQKDIDYVQFLTQQDLLHGSDHPDVLAAWGVEQLYWGIDHPLRWGARGSKASIRQLSKDHIQSSFERRWRNVKGTMIVVSPHTTTDILQHCQTHLPNSTPQKPLAVPHPMPQFGDFHLPKHDISQVELRVIRPVFGFEHPLYWGMELGTMALGGIFYSRLNQVLRKEEGLTYGASASYNYYRQNGYFQLAVSAEQQKIQLAIEKTIGILNDCAHHWSEEELEMTKKNLRQQFIDLLGTNSSLADIMESCYFEGKDPCQLEQYLSQAFALTQHDIEGAMRILAASPQILLLVGKLPNLPISIKQLTLSKF